MRLFAVLSGALWLAGAAFPAKITTIPVDLPLAFEPNRGQADPRVKFLSRGPGYTMLFTSDGAVLRLEGRDVTMRLAGSRRAPPVEAFAPLPGKSNYFAGSDPSRNSIGSATCGVVNIADASPM